MTYRATKGSDKDSRMQTTGFQRMRRYTRRRRRLYPYNTESIGSKHAEREEVVVPCLAARIELPINRIEVQGCLSGRIDEYENLLKELEIYQDNGMFKEHDQLVTEKIRYYEGRKNFTMVWVLKIEKSATYSYQNKWKQARKQLFSVIYSDLMVEYSNLIKARALYLLVAHMRRKKKYRKSKTGLSCLLNYLDESKQLLHGYNSPEDWAELYQTCGCVRMDYMSQLPLDKRNVEQEKAMDCFRRAIYCSEQDHRERVQMKRQSYVHLKLAMIHLGCCSTFPPAQENHCPQNDIKEAEKHLAIIQSKFHDTIPTATWMLLWKTQSDLFYCQGQYQLAKNKAEDAYKCASIHQFKTELNTLQERKDLYQKKLETHDRILSASEKSVRHGAYSTSNSGDSAESAARQITSESSLPPEKQSNRRTAHKGYKLQQKVMEHLQKQRKEAKLNGKFKKKHSKGMAAHKQYKIPQKDLSLSTKVPTTQDTPVKENQGKSGTALSVGLLASEWDSSKGGLSTINRQLATEFAQHEEVKVTLLVPQFSCSEEGKRIAESHKVSIREAERRPGYDDPLDWLSFPPRDLTIDIIVGHGVKLGKQAQVIRESRGCKWVQVVHTAPEELGMYKGYSKAISKGEEKNRTEVDLCKLADVVLAIGPKLKEAYSSQLRSCGKHEDIIQLTPGMFYEFSDVTQVAKDCNKFKVLIFGRGDPEDFSLKGYDIAAKAIAKLKDRSYKLIFVGAPDGKQEEVAKNLLKSHISKRQLTVRKFLQSRERLKELFCEVDLAIMPSRTEGFGLTALEALSAGLPVLVSRNSGFGKTLRTLPSGKSFVVNSEKPKEWAKAIRTVRQKGRAQRLLEVQRLQTSYEEKFSWEKQCEALIEKMWSLAHDLPGQMIVNLLQMQSHGSKVSSNADLSAELERIASDKGFVISDNEGSGNCMFHALSEQLNLVKGIKISHGELRQSIVQYLRKNPKLPDRTDLFNFIDGYRSWADYLTYMEQDGTWGDHVILYATANCYKTCIDVISSQSNHRDLTIRPDGDVISTNPLVLGHVREVHYVSLQPKQEISLCHCKLL